MIVESLVYTDADLVSPVVSTERTKGGNLEVLMLGYWLLSLDVIELTTNVGNYCGFSDGKVLGRTHGDLVGL